MIHVDGSVGEGGGQVVRTSLALAVITGQPLHLVNIRAGRRKPGLLRQHLTGLRAAVAISGGRADGDELGSREVRFRPGPVKGGAYRFAIGSAGSANLVLQTLLPALLYADAPTELTLEGGTHNSKSPTADFMRQTFLPQLSRFGCSASLTLERYGFYPAGGGQLRARVEPGAPSGHLRLHDRGPVHLTAQALVCNLPGKIAKRELAILENHLPLDDAEVRTVRGPGPGNVISVTATTGGVTETFTGFGERGVRAETVAKRLAQQVKTWMALDVPVGEHLADQLLLPMALAGAGAFTTSPPSLHTLTNMNIIETFLKVQFSSEERTQGRWQIAVQPR